MDIQQAIQYLTTGKAVMLLSEADPQVNDETRETIENIIEAMDMGIGALKQKPAIYYIDKEGNDGKNET